MLHTAIDYHKKYSVIRTEDAAGERVCSRRIDWNDPAAFAGYFAGLPEESRVVMEACWNWGWLYDLLGELPQVHDRILAHPYKTRLIADAQIKTDGLDAKALCMLLRGNLVASVHAPSPETRARKHVLRQRMFWVGLRTRVRNRIHTVIDRQRALKRPVFKNLFCQKGVHWLRELELPDPDGVLLKQDLRGLEMLDEMIREMERHIAQDSAGDPAVALLESLPGVGPILAAVIAAEIDGIGRFRRADKLCGYCGLAPTTSASGGHVHHGRMMPFANRWLKWAFIEASWVAMGCSPYFGDLYQRHRNRGKKANTAITIVARRMCRITWQLLTEQRSFSPNPPAPVLSLSPAAPITD